MLLFLALSDKTSEREKISLLYEKYKKKMFYTAYSVLNERYLAEDAVHEAFIAISRNISKINDVDSPETGAYVCRAAKSRALNILESKKREYEQGGYLYDSEEIAFEESEFERICTESELSHIIRCINALPDKYRHVIILRYLDDMAPLDIAALLGRNTETVKKQLLRGRKILMDSIKEEGRE